MLVDRYKYLDLFPCTPLELKIMGYVVSDITIKILSSDYYKFCYTGNFNNFDLTNYLSDIHSAYIVAELYYWKRGVASKCTARKHILSKQQQNLP